MEKGKRWEERGIEGDKRIREKRKRGKELLAIAIQHLVTVVHKS